MKYRAGIGVNVVVIAALGLMVLLASGFMVQLGSSDISDTTSERSDSAQCDTWAEQSMTVGSDEKDIYEQRYDKNCEGNLEDVRDGDGGFFESDYNPEEHESDGYFDSGDAGSGGAATIEEGESVEMEQVDGSIEYIGRGQNTISGRVYLKYNPNGNMESITGSATGDMECGTGNNIISGFPLDELPSGVNECAYTSVGDTMEGRTKFSICSFTSNGVQIAVGSPDESGSEICEQYTNVDVE